MAQKIEVGTRVEAEFFGETRTGTVTRISGEYVSVDFDDGLGTLLRKSFVKPIA